jgi:hypothetical protein
MGKEGTMKEQGRKNSSGAGPGRADVEPSALCRMLGKFTPER